MLISRWLILKYERDQVDILFRFNQAISNLIFQRHYNDHIYYIYKNNIYYLLNTFLLLKDDLKRVWKKFRESYTRSIQENHYVTSNITEDSQ